jgi:hypothetical protein
VKNVLSSLLAMWMIVCVVAMRKQSMRALNRLRKADSVENEIMAYLSCNILYYGKKSEEIIKGLQS